MSRASIRNRPRPHMLWLAMVTLALAMKVLVPAGYMIEAPRADQGLTLVLCTADGMITVPVDSLDGGHGDSQDAPESPSHSPCVFSGHGVHAPAVTPQDLGEVPWEAGRQPGTLSDRGVIPGRGLAAPPPPARGPPLLTT